MARSTWIGDRAARPRDSVDIGRDVWIGASSVILGGIAIGQGSVVGAGSVVTRDIPEYSIVVGNPARVIGRRFENEADRMRHTAILDERLLNSVESAKPL
ncbi:DapH/DapD/GlmU-related protein [Arthrobacter sp. AFG7.2]|uniref:DapH/DapD/GlmU-related protein n=1 Tax=Arthrobacter sp. AFG7.2 TaxID=1688693 RepID=UPI001CB990E6|nr:DapH/DapD/GlmU-related protein [Arthrobacter sp. AFG7.2]